MLPAKVRVWLHRQRAIHTRQMDEMLGHLANARADLENLAAEMRFKLAE